MAKVRIKVDGLIEKIKAAFKGTLSNDSLYVEIVEFSVERIKQRARLGKRMVDNAGEEDLPELSENYRKYKRDITPGARGTDPTFFRPSNSRSNLTLTGQLLDSLKGKILKRGPDVGKIELEFSGARKSRRDGETETKKTNQAVYKDLLDRNPKYDVLALNKKAIERIQNLCLTRLRQELRRLKLK